MLTCMPLSRIAALAVWMILAFPAVALSAGPEIFLQEAHYFLLPSSYLERNVDITRRSFPGPEREESWRVSDAIVAWLMENFRAEGRLVYESISNENGVVGKDATDAVFQAALSYQYR